MFILLNPKAAGGRGLKRWKKIKPKLKERAISFQLSVEPNEIMKAYESGERHFVAAGGDGTVNLMASCLIDYLTEKQLQEVTLGAIGIGSSNDYHKTAIAQEMLAGFPCQINRHQAVFRDIMVIKEQSTTHYALLNVGMGVTAQANHTFNQGQGIVGLFKRLSTPLAIVAAALRTIHHYIPQRYQIFLGKEAFDVQLANLNILKSPHIAGCFCYPQPFVANDGQAVICLLQDAAKWPIIKTLVQLIQNQFPLSEKKKQLLMTTDSTFYATAEQPFPVEFDGEICVTNAVTISIKKNMLRCC